MADGDSVKQPFAEQLAAIRLRTANLIPTQRWTDVMGSAHDKGFMVAGVMKTDMLSEFAEAITKVGDEGKSIEWFRKNFDSLVGKYGWDYQGERNWRTRTIYTTNLRTSYAAGRRAQQRDPDLLKVAPFLMYRHGDSKVPRQKHLAWDKLVFRADDPWVEKHYPPNEFGCTCDMIAVSQKMGERLGGKFVDEAPPDEPGAIGKGWDYTPGGSVSTEIRNLVQQKASEAPASLASALKADVDPVDVRAFAAEAMKVADRKIDFDLGAVRNVDAIREATGFDLAGFRRVLDNYGVRHTLANHGNAAREEARGQLAVTADDFGLLTTIMDFFDQVFADGKNRVGRDVLVFTKEIDGIGYRHVVEIRDGKRLVVTDSMRKKNGAWDS